MYACVCVVNACLKKKKKKHLNPDLCVKISIRVYFSLHSNRVEDLREIYDVELMTYTAVDRLSVFYFVCCYVILASESKEACFFLFLEKISSGSEVCDIKWGGDGVDKPGV